MDLSDWIERQAAFTPDKAALVCERQNLSYADFARSIASTAAALAACGVQRGDRVAHLGYNSAEQLSLLFACARVGALFVPLSWRLAPPEHRAMLADCTPRVLVVADPFVDATTALLNAEPHMLAVCIGAERSPWTSYERFVARGAQHTAPAGGASDASPVLLCYTSGSTGQPKGVVLTQGALFHNALNSVHMHNLSSRDVVLTTLPLFHVGGLNIQTLPALYCGATVVLHPRFEPGAVVDAIEHAGITLTVLVPAQLEMLGAEPRWRSANVSGLRAISTGSTIISESFVRKNLQRGVPLLQVYGATETCPIAACAVLGDRAQPAGSVGKAALHCELRIVDEAGRDVDVPTPGEIWVRGPNVMREYWNHPQETAQALAAGWYHSGDIGYADGNGYVYVVGRCKDVIISGGENIYPAEIENLLAESPEIAEVAVVGRPDERWGEAVVAVVVPVSGANVCAEHITALLAGRVARYKHPRDIVFTDSLPRTALGKIKREELRRIAQREPA